MDNNLLIVLGFCRWVVDEDWWGWREMAAVWSYCVVK